jgi:hypothetical protein
MDDVIGYFNLFKELKDYNSILEWNNHQIKKNEEKNRFKKEFWNGYHFLLVTPFWALVDAIVKVALFDLEEDNTYIRAFGLHLNILISQILVTCEKTALLLG